MRDVDMLNVALFNIKLRVGEVFDRGLHGRDLLEGEVRRREVLDRNLLGEDLHRGRMLGRQMP